jgi:hypothetical protein
MHVPVTFLIVFSQLSDFIHSIWNSTDYATLYALHLYIILYFSFKKKDSKEKGEIHSTTRNLSVCRGGGNSHSRHTYRQAKADIEEK